MRPPRASRTCLPAYAGFLLAREVETLTGMLVDPERPFVAVLGGSKVSDKFAVSTGFLDLCDALLIGGGMCFTFLVAQGMRGRLVARGARLGGARRQDAREGARAKGVELVLPVDFVVADGIAADARTDVVGAGEIPAGKMGLDIGPTTAELFKQRIRRAATIFWNGPMGVFELAAVRGGHQGRRRSDRAPTRARCRSWAVAIPTPRCASSTSRTG